jgi:hypothetical protein
MLPAMTRFARPLTWLVIAVLVAALVASLVLEAFA